MIAHHADLVGAERPGFSSHLFVYLLNQKYSTRAIKKMILPIEFPRLISTGELAPGNHLETLNHN